MIDDDEAYGLRCTIGMLEAENRRLRSELEGRSGMDFRKELGRRIAAARKAAGMTQRDVADALHVSCACVSYYETGSRMPNPMVIRDISYLFDVMVDDLIPDLDR